MKEHNKPKFLYCFGLSVRTGTNYLGRMMYKHPKIDLLHPSHSTAEFPFFRQRVYDHIEAFLSQLNQKSCTDRISTKELLNRFLDSVEDQYAFHYNVKNPYVFVKDPSVENLEGFLNGTDKKAVIIIRDGRDQCVSFVNSANKWRKNQSLLTNLKRKFKFYFLLTFIEAAKTYAARVEKLSKHMNNDRLLIIKYENLYHNPKETICSVLDFYSVPYTDKIIENMLNSEVVGTSELFNSNKSAWVPRNRDESFNPIGRYKQWNWIRNSLYNKLAGTALKTLQYN